MSVRFRFDWVDVAPSPDSLARHTMAAFSIEAGSATVTSVLDRPSRAYRDHVVVPLFSVAEWLVSNWWHIFCEIEDTGEQRPGFDFRHNLTFAGDGFVLPSLAMVPASGRMRLRWSRYSPPHARIEFVDDGEAYVAREELEAQFRDLIDGVLDRLRGNGMASEALDSEWAAVNALDPDEREFSRAAALLGVDPFNVPDSLAGEIVTFWDNVDPFIRDEALAAASADTLSRVRNWLVGSSGDLEGARNGSGWSEIRQALAQTSPAAPWRRGYDLARSARCRLGSGDGRFDFASTGPLALHLGETRAPSPRIQGLVAENAPACVTVPKGESGKRFLLARALGDYLGRSTPRLAILSSLATDRQARSRAFAAEFLAPAESLRRRLKSETVEPERVDELGSEFGVSSEVIRRQMENHGLATVAGW